MTSMHVNKINTLVNDAILKGTFPGVEILVTKKRKKVLHRVWGKESKELESPNLSMGKIFDLASMTKPLATTLAIMKLVELGEIFLEQKIGYFFSKLSLGLKGDISIQQLLSHTSGFPSYEELFNPHVDYDAAKKRLFEIELQEHPGAIVRYSCLDFLILGELVRLLTDVSLDQFCSEYIFKPAGLKKTGFKLNFQQEEFVPTAFCKIRNSLLRGKVHDENAFLFLEEGGNAGLFSTADEVAKLVHILMEGGSFQGNSILSPKSIELMWGDWNERLPTSWGLGWDYNRKGNGFMTCGDYFPQGSVGHVGFTGTSLWIDRKEELVVIILSNRVNISRSKNLILMKNFRPIAHNLIHLMSQDY